VQLSCDLTLLWPSKARDDGRSALGSVEEEGMLDKGAFGMEDKAQRMKRLRQVVPYKALFRSVLFRYSFEYNPHHVPIT